MTAHLPSDLNVSRETLARLQLFAALLEKWNPKINLVAKSTIPDLWSRHIVDSVQVWNSAPKTAETWLDMGSGGGFPGIVVAILAAELAPQMRVTLIESDQRKCAFLRTVIREAGLSAIVLSSRIMDVPSQKADIISARALADLDALLDMAAHHGHSDTLCLFPKGATWQAEVHKAKARWAFSCAAITSITEPKAVVLKIQGVSRV